MVESLKDFIEKLKKQQKASGKGTLSWYLEQLRELAAKKAPKALQEPKTSISSADAIAKAREEKNAMTFEEAQEIAKNATVEQTSTTFDRSMIGKMLFFQYDAKTKDKLPYWDMFPLAFLFKVSNNSALGINMHYLPPVERARLMMALWS